MLKKKMKCATHPIMEAQCNCHEFKKCLGANECALRHFLSHLQVPYCAFKSALNVPLAFIQTRSLPLKKSDSL